MGSLDCPPHPAPLLSSSSFYLPLLCPIALLVPGGGGSASWRARPCPPGSGWPSRDTVPPAPEWAGRVPTLTPAPTRAGLSVTPKLQAPVQEHKPRSNEAMFSKRSHRGAHTAARLSLSGGDGEERQRQRAPAVLEGDSGTHPAISNGPARELIGTWGGQ